MTPEEAAQVLIAAAAAHRAGRLDEAESLYSQILAVYPDQPEVLHRLALVALAQDRDGEAVGLLEQALAAAPGMTAAMLNLALAQGRLGRAEAALAAYDRALALAPGVAEIHLRRADQLQGMGDYEASVAAYDRVLALDPGLARAWSNRAVALMALDRPLEAVDSGDRALAIAPDFVDALVNRGLAQREAGQLDASIASLAEAAAAAPDNAAAACNLGVSRLLAGQLEPGFAGHELRWRLEPNRSLWRDFDRPQWLGREDLAGKTLLLHAEQGFGDTIQFCRYAALAKARGARVLLEVQPALKALMRSLAGVDELVGRGEPLPPFDLHCPLMSLPLAFGTTLQTIPAAPAYLAPPADRLAAWAAAAPASPRLKVGLVWFGKPTHLNDRNRSIDLARLMVVMPPSVELYSLQDRSRDQDQAALAAHPQIRRFDGRLNDFADTAALASLMDVVVSVDTSAAHLAAALGRPTWILLPFSPDWRWLQGREDSPWYPTARLFRQPAIGDWDGVMIELRRALAANSP